MFKIYNLEAMNFDASYTTKKAKSNKSESPPKKSESESEEKSVSVSVSLEEKEREWLSAFLLALALFYVQGFGENWDL